MDEKILFFKKKNLKYWIMAIDIFMLLIIFSVGSSILNSKNYFSQDGKIRELYVSFDVTKLQTKKSILLYLFIQNKGPKNLTIYFDRFKSVVFRIQRDGKKIWSKSLQKGMIILKPEETYDFIARYDSKDEISYKLQAFADIRTSMGNLRLENSLEW